MEEETLLFDESMESWKLTPSGKFQLFVIFDGLLFKSASIDKDKCRNSLNARIKQAIELKIVREVAIHGQ